MGHVQFILDMRKKSQTGSQSGPMARKEDFENLPGFHRREKLVLSALSAQKHEYNASLQQLQALVKKANSQKAKDKRMTRQQIEHLKTFMADLLTKIGAYTEDEEGFGFKEDDHGF